MSQQYLNDGDEKETRSRPTEEPERREAPHEDVAPEEASSRTDEPVEAEAVEPMTTNTAPRRQRRNKNGDASEAQAADQTDADPEESASMSDDDDLRKLMALGFTHDEATRLIDVSVRITNSNEARDAEATRKRLQFAKWLVEQGVLDEFSLRD